MADQDARSAATVRVSIGTNEWYPVYDLEVDDQGEYDVPAELVERYNSALSEWHAVQDLLEKAESRG